MATPEGKVKDKVKKILSAWRVYFHMPVQNGMGKPSLDFVCCHRGHFFSIETKAADGQLTLRQQQTIKEMEDAGAKVFVIRGLEESAYLPLLHFLELAQ